MAAAADDDFIDIDISPPNCSPQSREFEFQMSSLSNEKDSSTSPADELFYKGKLLPLHLPPRLQMVQKLLHTPEEACEDCINVPFFSSSTAPSTTACCTPVDSCNISPSESCRVSCELNPSDFFFQWSTDEFRSFIHNHTHPKKSWSKKLKLMKQSSFLSQKLKTSRAYLKAWFIKSACSNESSSKAAGKNREAAGKNREAAGKNREAAEQQGSKLKRVAKKIRYGAFSHEQMKREDNITEARRSFSGAIKRHSPSKCLSSSSSDISSSGTSSLSSSFSVNSNTLFDLHLFKRCSSDPSEIETSIEAAIAHCKNSQKPSSQQVKVGFCSMSCSNIASHGENLGKAGS